MGRRSQGKRTGVEPGSLSKQARIELGYGAMNGQRLKARICSLAGGKTTRLHEPVNQLMNQPVNQLMNQLVNQIPVQRMHQPNR